MNKFKRFLSLALAVLMIFSYAPTIAYATEGGEGEDNSLLEEENLPLNSLSETEPLTETYVAQIGETKYATLKDAINNANDGDTITLLADVEYTDCVITIEGSGKKTLDLNGHTITGTVTEETTALVYVTGGCELTIKDSSNAKTGGIHAVNTNGNLSNLIRVETDAKMVIESGNFTQDASTNGCGMIDSRGNEIITINGGNYHLGNVGSASNESPWVINTSGKNEYHVTVTGGTYNFNVLRQYWVFEVQAPDRYYAKDNGNGTWTITPNAKAAVIYKVDNYENELCFETLEEAVLEADGNDRIKIFVDYTVAEGKTIQLNDGVECFTDENVKVTLTSGSSIKGNFTGEAVAAEGCELVETGSGDNQVITAKAYVAQIGETKYATLQDAIDKAKDNDTITLLTNIDIANCEIKKLDDKYNTYFLVKGKSVTINLNEKKISGAYSGSSMLVGVFSTDNNGHLTLTGNGTIDVTANTTVYSMFANYESGCSITIENGTYKLDKAGDSLIYTGGDEDVIVKGGTFTLGNVGTGSNGSPWIFNAGGQNTANIIVTGGTFNADIFHQHYIFEVKATTEVAEKLGVPVKAAKDNGDGTWTVVDAVAYVDEQHKSGNWYTQNTGYATLEEAFAAAGKYANDDKGYTVTLVANVEITGKVEAKFTDGELVEIVDNGFEIVLADEDAELTAQEGLNVTTNVTDGEVVYENDVYSVRVYNPIVTITFNNAGTEMTLKYPSERYDTIQKLIGTNSYADFVLGASQHELLAYVADGRASNIVMTLHDDIELEAPINFYNKYFQVDASGYELNIVGNGNTITWADGYNGTLLNVESGVSVTVENLTIDGENEFTFYNDTTTVENGQNWYTRFVNVGEEDKAVNANVIVNAGNLTLGEGTKIQNVTIASDGDNGKTENTESGYILKYNDDLAIIKSNGGKVTMEGTSITGNAGMVLNAINAETVIDNSIIDDNMGCGNKGGIILANGGTMKLTNSSICGNKAMARSATVLGVINGAEVSMNGNTRINNNKHLGVGSNTAGAMVVLEGPSQFVMNGGSISNNAGGRAGAIASRWVGGNYGQHEDTSIVLNAGTIAGNTASNDSWNGASVFLRSPATIGEGMKVDGTIAVNAAPGELDITGGEFTNFGLIVTNGLSAEITGGTFDKDPTEWCAEEYAPKQNEDGTYTVINYIEWIKAKLLAGNNVTLDRNIVVDGSMIESIPAVTNGNGKYPNYGIFNIVGDHDVTFDLNGHTITYNGHADFEWDGKTYNSCTVAHGLFFANAGADFTVVDSSEDKSGTVMVYGLASGAYVASPDTTFTIKGGTWKNEGCDTCRGTNIFLYPLQGGELYIEGGHFEQALDSEGESYLIVEHGGAYANSVIDYSKTKVEISGGTFVGMNPGEIKKFNQTANNKLDTTTEPITDGCAAGYEPVKNNDGTWTVELAEAARYNDSGDFIKAYEKVQDALNDAVNGDTVLLLKDATSGFVAVTNDVTLDLNGKVLTATYVTVFGDLIDSSEENTGRLAVSSTSFMIRTDNKQLPVKTADGYAFVEVVKFNTAIQNDGAKFVFQPILESSAVSLFVNGSENTDVKFIVRVSWTKKNDNTKRSQDFEYVDSFVTDYFQSYGQNNSGKYGYALMFTLTLNNISDVENLDFEALVISDKGVSFGSK